MSKIQRTTGALGYTLEVNRHRNMITMGCFKCEIDKLHVGEQAFNSLLSVGGFGEDEESVVSIRKDIATIREMMGNPEMFKVEMPEMTWLKPDRTFWVYRIGTTKPQLPQTWEPLVLLSDDLAMSIDAWPDFIAYEARVNISKDLARLELGEAHNHRPVTALSSTDDETDHDSMVVWVRAS